MLGAAVVTVPPPARSVVAAGWADGLSASLKAGMAAIEHGADGYAVLHTVDTPDIGADVVQRVLTAARETRSGIARACFTRRPGHPVVVARRHWRELVGAARGDEGARVFLSRHDVLAVECADLATGDDIDE